MIGVGGTAGTCTVGNQQIPERRVKGCIIRSDMLVHFSCRLLRGGVGRRGEDGALCAFDEDELFVSFLLGSRYPHCRLSR